MTLKEINSKIFEIVKDKESILYSELPKLVGVDLDLVLPAINKLNKEYRLISVNKQILSLSKEGEKYKTFELYLKSLKKETLNWYLITPIILTIIFGCSTIYFLKKTFDLKENQSDVIIENYFLKSQIVSYKDSIVELKNKIIEHKENTLLDTLQTKN